MKNLSYNPTAPVERVEVVEIDDDRAFISIIESEVGFFLTKNGKPLIFKNTDAAESYAVKKNLQNYVIDEFKNFDFTGIEIIEV